MRTEFLRNLSFLFKPPKARSGNYDNPSIQRLRSYLTENVMLSEQSRAMSNTIKLFRANSPRIIISKCIDGRCHGDDNMGFPPNTVTTCRTDGNRIVFSPDNYFFFDRVHSAIASSRFQTPDCPSLFIALAHTSVKGSGCAAHKENTDHAIACVQEQAKKLAELYPKEMYSIYGLTNTDDGGTKMYFRDAVVDPALLIQDLGFQTSNQIFTKNFLENSLDIPSASRSVHGKTPNQLIQDGSMFSDLFLRIPMQCYLFCEIAQTIQNRDRNNTIFETALFNRVKSLVDSVQDLPSKLKPIFVYNTLWNVAWILNERSVLNTLSSKEVKCRVNHNEFMVGYGEGFDLVQDNTLIIVKPGRGNDCDALQVARNVLLKNNGAAMPKVHVNLEISGHSSSFDEYASTVIGRLMTRVAAIKTVFGDLENLKILVTYSRRFENCFYPIQLYPDHTQDEQLEFPININDNLDERLFNREEITIRERLYKEALLMESANLA